METFTFNKYVEQKYVLKCGLTIQYFPYPTYHTNHMGFVIPFGSNMSQYEINGKRVKSGIAHFLEHRMFDSSDGDISELFARVGASANAYTYFDRTCYYCSTTYDPMEAFKILFRLVSEFVSTKQKVANERKIIIQEMLEDLARPSVEMSFKMNERLFTDAVFKNPIIGSKKDINDTSDDDLFDAFNAFYDISKMTLIVVGPMDIEPIIEYIEAHYIPKKGNVILKKVSKDEDFSSKKYRTVYLERDIVERIQGLNLKIDVKELKQKFGRYKYETVMDYALSLLFDIGSPFIEEFNKLNVGFNSFNYQYVDVDDIGLLSIKYLAHSSRKANRVILDALANPEKYLSTRSLELFERRSFGKKLMLLQDTFNVFQEISINIDDDYNFLELFHEDNKITLEDIIYFIKYLKKGIILRGVLIPNDERVNKDVK